MSGEVFLAQADYLHSAYEVAPALLVVPAGQAASQAVPSALR